MSVPSSRSSSKSEAGKLGEEFVAGWLTRQGRTIVAQRWHCRWGELDLVVRSTNAASSPVGSIAFVEVKTRRDRNWDANGKLAITAQKQAKLWQTAQLFLLEHPDLAELPCQFDVALVSCEKLSGRVDLSQVDGDTVAIVQGYQLTLSEYIQNAFML